LALEDPCPSQVAFLGRLKPCERPTFLERAEGSRVFSHSRHGPDPDQQLKRPSRDQPNRAEFLPNWRSRALRPRGRNGWSGLTHIEHQRCSNAAAKTFKSPQELALEATVVKETFRSWPRFMSASDNSRPRDLGLNQKFRFNQRRSRFSPETRATSSVDTAGDRPPTAC
jgi:hypothetical protein